MKDNIKDLVAAVREDGITAALESDTFKASMVETASQIISGPAAPIAGSIIGAAAPRINGIILNYKQNRFERNVTRLIKELDARVDNLENNYLQLNDDMQEQYRGLYVEMLLDNVVDERQEEKIKWSANGFVDMMTNASNENIVQIFFDTLSELTVLDVDTLRMYHVDSNINWRDIEQKYGLDSDHMKIVKEKLVRLGLLYRKNDQLRDNNLDEIVDYMKKVEADSKKSKPQDVKLPNSIKKIGNIESYKITPLGLSFLKSIGET